MMKKTTRASALVLIFTFLFLKGLAQKETYPFEIKITGKGTKSLIFIPGFGCSGQVWDGIRPAYEGDFTCYTLTMAGFAGVPAKDSPSFKSWEKAIAGYIRQQKIIQPILVGHSMGGGLAMAIAADYPELVSAIVVVDALPCLQALMNPSFKAKENNDCATSVYQLTAMSNEQFLQMQKTGLTRLLEDTSKLSLVASWAVASDRSTFGEMYCDFSNTDLREKVRTVICPALILLEAYFVNLNPIIAAQFKNLKTANIQYATKGLHFIMYDDKEWLRKQMDNFLNGKKG